MLKMEKLKSIGFFTTKQKIQFISVKVHPKYGILSYLRLIKLIRRVYIVQDTVILYFGPCTILLVS